MAGCVGPVERHSRGVNFHDLQDSTPNQALERTADRRENLLLITSTLKLGAQLGIVSGRSAWSR
jgi:hypothetical protein